MGYVSLIPSTVLQPSLLALSFSPFALGEDIRGRPNGILTADPLDLPLPQGGELCYAFSWPTNVSKA